MTPWCHLIFYVRDLSASVQLETFACFRTTWCSTCTVKVSFVQQRIESTVIVDPAGRLLPITKKCFPLGPPITTFSLCVMIDRWSFTIIAFAVKICVSVFSIQTVQIHWATCSRNQWFIFASFFIFALPICLTNRSESLITFHGDILFCKKFWGRGHFG